MGEDWDTSHLDGKCPKQIGYVYVRPVCFQVQPVSVASLSGVGVLELNQDRMASFFKMVTVVDRMGSVTDKLLRSTTGRDLWRLNEISNMLDFCRTTTTSWENITDLNLIEIYLLPTSLNQ